MSFRTKLLASFAALGLAAIAVTDWQASSSASTALLAGTYERLTAIRETKRQLIETYFRDLSSHVLALSADESTFEALTQFRAAWESLPEPRLATLQRAFGDEARDLIVLPQGLGSYGKVHARYHPTLHRYQTAFGFYDIFLIDTGGRIVYTVFKESDIGGHLRQGPLASTTLARAFERALALDAPEKSVLEDYAPYAPSQHSPAAFVAAPIWRAGAKAGILAIQVSAGEVSRAMQSEALGGSGRAYLIGADGKLRSEVRDSPETAILRLSLDRALFERKPGTETGTGLNGASVLRSHTPLSIPGLDWMLVAEIDQSEAFAPLQSLRTRTVLAGLAVSALFLAAAWKLGRSVSRPVLALAEGARRLAERDFNVRLPIESNDEIGELAASFNSMARRLDETTVSRDEFQRLNQRLIHAQEDERRRLARELHDDITQRLAALAIRAGQLKQSTGPEAGAEMERMQRTLSRISDDIHGLSRRLHPAIVDELGLVAAIESECRGFFEGGGPPVEFEHSGTTANLTTDASLALYRIVQESLRNTLKHARATEVRIGLHSSPAHVKLTVEDNGAGFDPAAPERHTGLGLASMQERVHLLNGSLRIDSSPNAGTRISVTLPYEETSHPAS